MPDFLINTTEGFDAGTKNDLITATDQYLIALDKLEISMPYASKHANLQSYYRLEADGLDACGNNTGTVYGSPTFSAAKYDNGITTGLTKYVGLGTYFGKPVNFSISLWLKPGAWTTMGIVFSCDAGATDYTCWGLLGRSGGSIEGWVSNGTTGQQGSFTGTNWNSTNFPNSVFTHLVLTVDGSKLRLYRNGVESGTGITQSVQQAGTAYAASIGRPGAYNGLYFGGMIDEVKIYNTALSQAEITALYNSSNRYKTSGDWRSDTITTPTGKKLLNMTIYHSGLSAARYIDKIEILKASDNSVLSTRLANIESGSSTTLLSADFDNGFDPTLSTDIKIKVYLVGETSGTPAITKIEGNFSTSGWAGKMNGVTNPSTVAGVSKDLIQKINGVVSA